jgi:diguanylate cyclase (GGDEF)-like protein
VQVDGLGVDYGAGVDVRPDVLRIVQPALPPVELEGPVLHLDRVERHAAAVDTLLAERPDLTGAASEPWLTAVAALLDGDAVLGDHDRAQLLSARACVLLAQVDDAAGSACDDAVEAALLLERCADVLPAATAHAIAALAAVRAGDVGRALDHAVQALVAFGSLSDGERDPDGEAGMAEILGRLCEQFFDHDRALQFYELAVRGLRDVPHDPARERSVQARIADLLLHSAGDADGQGQVDRAADIARGLLGDAAPNSVAERTARRLIARVLCAEGRPAEGSALLADLGDAAGNDPELLLTRARCLHVLGRDEDALADLDAAEALFAAAGDLARQIAALELRSVVAEVRGDVEAALRDARLLAELVWQRHRRQVSGFMDQVWSRAGVEGQRRDLEARARMLLRFAEQDSLTSLANRRAMERFCTTLRPTEQICLVLVDVDHFKDVNDRHGHLVGDVVLREVAAVLSGSVRAMDRVARWGGEEFLIALPGGSAGLGAEAGRRLRRRIEEHSWSQHAPGLRLTVSAGVSAGPAGEFETVLSRADAAVYAAKRAGRNRVITS